MRTCFRMAGLAAAAVFLAALTGCGSPPMVRESKLLATDAAKASSLCLYYRNVPMRTVSTQSYGRGAAVSDNGFSDFAGRLVEQAGAVFAQRRVSVIAAQAVEGDDPVRIDAGPRNAEGGSVPALVLMPTQGQLSANGHVTMATFVFSAQLFDPRSRRMVWTATIDTRSWVGQDFVMRNFQKTSFDAAYAKQLLEAVAEQMARDGVI